MKKAIIKIDFAFFTKMIKIKNKICPRCGSNSFRIGIQATITFDVFEHIDGVYIHDMDYDDAVCTCNLCEEDFTLQYEIIEDVNVRKRDNPKQKISG